MADNDPSQIRVAANGNLWIAGYDPTGDNLPDDVDDDLGGLGFEKLGLVNADGVVFTDGKTVEDYFVWQMFYAARKIVTEKTATAVFALSQWNSDTVPFAFGGGEITATANGVRYSPPPPETIDERTLIVESFDGGVQNRFVIVRGMVSDNVETNLVRTGASELPITFGMMGVDGEDPWYLLSNDPALEVTAS